MLFEGRDIGEMVNVNKVLYCFLFVWDYCLIEEEQIEFVGLAIL